MPEIENKGVLFLVPTPIGNMGDITPRALECLEQSEMIACEDTRLSGRLLSHFGIRKKLISYHDFNEQRRLPQLLEVLNSGGNISVITDAGSPGLSDPAFRIIRAAIENNIRISPLPGANALIPALTGSGLPLDRFFFEGFLPNKGAARRNRLEKLKELEHTLVFYESPHRIEKTVADALEILGDRQACLARELSKIYEEFIRGSLSEILETAGSRKLKGEMVLVIEGLGRKLRKSDE
ncbi:MAG: 16S rRNA (cytidine(1402)-2'-O)-methyltransferase [candidate division Zixibacteria bacterium HGW-Zixibacteria-1]|nr:MAG: 16S rRNA (cytidine(1402)-2'-O)-methyltransferase [candidate division Zixibacteria bacterium HGW-Zixibacteria-1]